MVRFNANRSCLSLFAITLICSPLAAQDMGGAVGFNNVTNSICGGSCDAPAPRQDTFVDVAQLNASIAGQQRVASAANSNFTYKYSRERTSQNIRLLVSKLPDPTARTAFEQMFAAQPTMIDDIRAGIRPYGLDSHNVADAYAMWWINAWLASEKLNIDTDIATVNAVKRQVYAAFAATPDFAKISDIDRQQYAESLLIHGLMMAAGLDQFEHDPKLLEQLAQSARQGAKASYDIDLSKMTLTSNGFVPRDGADASGAVGGAEDTVRNARTDAPAAEGKGSSLGLALAAGAGLGVTLLGGLALMRRTG